MALKITSVTREEYDNIAKNKVSFMQTLAWGDMRMHSGFRPDFYLVKSGDQVLGAFLALAKTRSLAGLKLTACYIPRPLFFFDAQRSDGVDEILRQLKHHYKLVIVEYNYPHWISQPPESDSWRNTIAQQGVAAGYLVSAKHIQPDMSIIKPIPEGDVYDSIDSTSARRNARLGFRRATDLGVTYEHRNRLSDTEIEQAASLMQTIAQKRHFNTRQAPYFANMQDCVPSSHWYIAAVKDKLLLATLCVYDPFNQTDHALYLGYHNPFDREIYLTYASRLDILRQLQQRGAAFYDQWGYSDDPKSPLFQLSEAKKRFGGQVIHYPPALVGSRIPGLARLLRDRWR